GCLTSTKPGAAFSHHHQLQQRPRLPPPTHSAATPRHYHTLEATPSKQALPRRTRSVTTSQIASPTSTAVWSPNQKKRPTTTSNHTLHWLTCAKLTSIHSSTSYGYPGHVRCITLFLAWTIADFDIAALQIPYLLNIASDFNDWLQTPTSFSVAHKASSPTIFGTLSKLDHCFASLLCGRDFVTSEPLPGFFNSASTTGGSGMSKTDMVRLKSTVQQTRVVIVDVLDNDDDGETSRVEELDDQDGEEGDDYDGDEWDDREKERMFMDVARVYENTLVKLGELLLE
ncbi:uncharacterized protein PODANS_4_1140, partial [Podospora anserina S mat+]